MCWVGFSVRTRYNTFHVAICWWLRDGESSMSVSGIVRSDATHLQFICNSANELQTSCKWVTPLWGANPNPNPHHISFTIIYGGGCVIVGNTWSPTWFARKVIWQYRYVELYDWYTYVSINLILCFWNHMCVTHRACVYDPTRCLYIWSFSDGGGWLASRSLTCFSK